MDLTDTIIYNWKFGRYSGRSYYLEKKHFLPLTRLYKWLQTANRWWRKYLINVGFQAKDNCNFLWQQD